MKRMLIAGVLLVVIILFTVYLFTGYYGYKKKDGVVYYKYLESAVFFFYPAKKEVKVADYATFVDMKKKSLGKDKNFAYYNGKPFDSIDVATFEYYDKEFVRDRNHIYKLSDGKILRLDADVKTFVALTDYIGKDKYYVYQQGKEKIEVSDVASFEFIANKSNYRWAKDKCSYYFYDWGRFHIVENIDYETFIPLMFGYAKDKNSVYYFNYKTQEIVTGANPETFKVLKNKRYKDGVGTDGKKYFIGVEEVTKKRVDEINNYSWFEMLLHKW